MKLLGAPSTAAAYRKADRHPPEGGLLTGNLRRGRLDDLVDETASEVTAHDAPSR